MRYSYLWSHLKPFRLAFLGLGVVLFAEILLTILAPIPVKYILNHLVEGGAETMHSVTLRGFYLGEFSGGQALWVLSLLAVLIGTSLAAASWLEQIWFGSISFKVNESIRRDLFHRLFTRRQTYLDSRKKVDIMGRISGDVGNIDTVVSGGVPAMVRDIPMITALLVMMFIIDLELSLVFSFCLPFFYFLGRYFAEKMRVTAKFLRRRTVQFEEETYEAISSMAIVKSLRGEEKIQRNLLGRVGEITSASYSHLHATQGLSTSMDMAQNLVRGGFIFLGVWSIFHKNIGLGDLFQLFAYMETLARHVNSINKFVSKFPKCGASMDRIEELNIDLEKFPETSGTQPLTPALLASAPGSLEFHDVSFQHGQSRKIFDHFSLNFPRQRLVAVVGQSGIGKTTFSRLLNRLSDPVEGEIRLAGHSLSEFCLKDLRSLVRIISQENFLISGTVRENLLLAMEKDPGEEALYKALEAVNASSFVKALPRGLATEIGEGGLQLSGGQSKRIHLARAFLDMESQIILLDEPTTGLDTISAQMVIDSIRNIAANKNLVFWVTHRMQEVFSADNVLFFSPSQNPIFSTHEELFRTNALYRALMEEEEKAPAAEAAADPRPVPVLI